ncbi:MAG: squalene synthase HpnC [Gemmataceae bacterium]
MDARFYRDLSRYGPHRSYAPVTRSAARLYCREFATGHYENFSVASLLLPRRLLQHFYNIYAYCRWADDLADETGGGTRSLALLRWWREELLDVYHGRPHHPVMVALQETIEQFKIPSDPFVHLLFAFEQDQLIKRYETMEQVMQYCRWSANPVGHLVLYLCDSYSPRQVELSDYICTGLQLANFWQDVARDHAIGRVYIPQHERVRFGYSEADLHAHRYNDKFVDLMRFLVDHARDLFYRGFPLVDLMPTHVQADIELFLRGGLSILRKIEKLHYNVWRTRPKLSKREKLGLIGRVAWRQVRAWLS